jgi:hypothetical protein
MMELLGAVLDAPRLPSPQLCRGKSAVFDEYEDPELVEYATHLCQSCPALAACGQWLDSLKPARRPRGVVAGRVIRPPQPRKPKAAA